MFKSLQILISRFKVSILILTEFNIGSLFVLNSSEAVIIRFTVSKQIFSILSQIPNLSFFGIFSDNK